MSQIQSATQNFLNGIGRIPLLSPDTTMIHARNVRKHLDWDEEKNGPVPSIVEKRGRRSLNILMESNLRLVVSIAKKYTNKNKHDLLDLVQEGFLGLRRGVQLYDPARGYKISTYLYWWIRQGITRSLIINNSLIKLPFGVSDQVVKIKAFSEKFQAKSGRQPLPEEIAVGLKISTERVLDLLSLATKEVIVSLDSSFGDHENPILELVAGEETNEIDDSLSNEDILIMMEMYKNIFDRDDVDLIKFCILSDGSMSDLAKIRGCSRERIRQKRNSCRRKLQRILAYEKILDQRL